MTMNKNMIRRTAAAAAALTLVSGCTWAAEPFSLDEIVVTATRTENTLKEVPATTEVITAQGIQRLGATDVYDALKLADNVTAMPQNNGFGRCISIRGGASNQTLILVNGRRIANEDTATVQNLLTLDRINVNTVDRIEIVRGAASAQYGSDALNGVINIITKKSDRDPSVTVGANTGTESMNNYYHVDLGKQGKFSGTLDASFGKNRSRLMQDGSMGYLYGPNQNYAFDGTYEFNDHQALNFNASYYKAHERADWPDFGSTVTEAYNRMLAADKFDKVPPFVKQMWLARAKEFNSHYNLNQAKLDTEQKNFDLSFTGKTERNDYVIRTYYSRLQKDRFLPEMAMTAIFQAMENNIHPYGDSNTYSVWGVEAKDTMKIGEEHTLTYGGDFTKNKIEGTNIAGASKDTSTYAFYAQDEWRLGDKLLLIPAVRYDHHSDFGSKTTPKIGATYFIDDNDRVKVNWGKGFKAPTVTELYAYFYHNGYIYGNPDLVPEESTNFDVSYEKEWNRNFGKVTYFHNKVDNMITTAPYGLSGTHYINLDGTTTLHGVELTLGRHFNDNWTFKVNSNWTSSSNDNATSGNEGHGTVGIADNMTTASLTYDDNDAYGWSATLWDQFATKYHDESGDYTFNTLNFVVNKKLGDGRIFLGLDNLLNKKVGAINLDGRMWRTGFEWKF